MNQPLLNAFRLGCVLALLLVALLLAAPRRAEAHRLKGSDSAADALIVQRGREAFSKGTFAAATRLDADGRVALDVSASPAAHVRAKAWYGEYLSAPVELPFPCVEFLPAWNVDLDPFTEGFAIDARLRWTGRTGDAAWSDWYHLGAYGIADPTSATLHLRDDDGEVDEDYILARSRAVALQWRWRVWRGTEPNPASVAPKAPPRLGLVTFAVSDPRPPAADQGSIPARSDSGTARIESSRIEKDPLSTDGVRGIEIPDFPWRSQVMGTRIDGRICCATSVNMALTYYGHPEPTVDTTQRCLDPRLRIYGVWPRATQVLSEAGLDAWIERFRTMEDTRPYLEKGVPILISIQARRGDIDSAPYKTTGGHILVLRGYDADGHPLVSDPATSDREKGYTKWRPEELQRVWLDNGGVGMIAARPEMGFPKPYVRRLAGAKAEE